MATLRAFASSSDGSAFVGEPRVDDAGFATITCCAVHQVTGLSTSPVLLKCIDFIQPMLVPRFKWCGQPSADTFADRQCAKHPGAGAQDVGVVVLSGQPGGRDIVNEGRPNSGKLVGGDAHSDSRATKQDPPLSATRDDRFSDSAGIVWVVNALVCIAAQIVDVVTIVTQHLAQGQSCIDGGMVRGDRNLHVLTPARCLGGRGSSGLDSFVELVFDRGGNLDDLAASVMPAFTADGVWSYRFATVSATADGRKGELVVLCAATVATRFGKSTLGDSHHELLLSRSRRRPAVEGRGD